MSSYEKVFKLKQHSPILHFQGMEKRVALRASEVKPKLDRYLIRQMKIKGKTPAENWLLTQTDKTNLPSLNYKMKIEASGEITELPIPKIYYGNMGDSNSNLAYCMRGDCKVTILCFNMELMNFIEEHISDFFVANNFGRMHNKGFGSYIVEGNSCDSCDIANILKKETGAKECYKISGYNIGDAYPTTSRYADRNGRQKENTIAPMFDDIKNLYQIMKSGYNVGRNYHHSVLFEYFHDTTKGNNQNIGNEKAYIKTKGITPTRYNPDTGRREPYYKNYSYNGNYYDKCDEFRYVRTVLGLGENFIYQPDKSVISIQHNAKDEESKIERFESPIFFKIIGNTIYISARRVNEGIYNREFVFRGNGKSVKLNTPEISMFDIDEFMEYFFNKYGEVKSLIRMGRRNLQKAGGRS